MRGIGKSYGLVRALDDVALQLERGEVLGIVGENGAGKSTLMKILGGAEAADSGAIVLDGETMKTAQTRAALAAGIVVIYQELSLVPERSIAENLYLGNLPRNAAGVVDRKRLNADAAAVLARVGLRVNPTRAVHRLRLAEQQLVEIARALTRKARVVVMDEPTSSLGEHDVEVIFSAIRALSAEGVGTIFISHHLEEVFVICDRVMVLRDGRAIETRATSAWTTDALVAAMVNRPMSEVFPERETPLGMNSFIVTLAMLAMARGLAFIVGGGNTVFGFPQAFDDLGGSNLGPVPIAALISLGIVAVGAFVLSRTVFGSNIYAVGGNREAARLAGIPVRQTLLAAYVVSGALAGVGGVILTGRLDSAQPIAATGLELNAIAAVVIGGASLFGGKGNIGGTLLGVLIIGLINNGLTLKNVQPLWVQFIQGAVIFAAALADSIGARRRGAAS